MNLLFYLFLSFAGGLMRACQGAYKDAPWEDFGAIKFMRSLAFGLVGGLGLYFFYNWMEVVIVPALFLASVVFADSILTEVYKRGFRVEDLSKYKMPTIFHLHGRLIRNRLLRMILGMLILVGSIALFWLVQVLDQNWVSVLAGSWQWGVLWGLFAGLVVALAGAALDAAWEGFEPLKFMRSIWHGAFWGFIFSHYTVSAGFLVYACLGADRMGLEFYKTFIRKMKSGKFVSDKPTHEGWCETRERILSFYMGVWLLFIALLVVA